MGKEVRKRRLKTKKERMLTMYTKHLKTSSGILEHLFKVYKTGLENGYDVVGVSYLIDLMVVHLMPYYNGDGKIIENLKRNMQNEMIAFNSSPPVRDTIDELKQAGIDFSVIYDVRKKGVVPSIDMKKLRLSDDDLTRWIELNLDKVNQLVAAIEERK